jgi:hypothetical protein
MGIGITAMLNAEVYRNGSVMLSHSQRAHSFLSNFMRELYAGFSGDDVGKISSSGVTRPSLCSNTSNTTTTIQVEQGFGLTKLSGAGGANGLVVGSGDTPFSVSQYSLAAEIAHGTSVGQLTRGATTFVPPSVTTDGKSVSMSIERAFVNDSGSDVVVKEVALKGYPYYTNQVDSNAVGDTHYFSRDVLDTPITVPPGQTLAVRVVIKTEL